MQRNRIQASVKLILAILLLCGMTLAQSWNGRNYGSAAQALTQNGKNFYPQVVDVFCDFETGSDGDVVDATVLASSCHDVGAGTWLIRTTLSQGPLIHISTDGQMGAANPKSVSGTQYTDSGGTRGLKIQVSNSNTGAYWAQYTFSGGVGTQTSVFGWVTVNLPNNSSAYAGCLGVLSNGGTDFINCMVNAGNIHLETRLNPNAASDICYGSCDANGFYQYTPGTTYGIALEFDEYPLVYHVLRIYSCVRVGTRCTPGALLNAQWKFTDSDTPHVATTYQTDFNDEQSATGTVYMYLDSLTISRTGFVIMP